LLKTATHPLLDRRVLTSFCWTYSFNSSSRDPAITLINLNSDAFPVALRSGNKGRTAAHERIKYRITDK
jgi:hypothetical protein